MARLDEAPQTRVPDTALELPSSVECLLDCGGVIIMYFCWHRKERGGTRLACDWYDLFDVMLSYAKSFLCHHIFLQSLIVLLVCRPAAGEDSAKSEEFGVLRERLALC